MRILTPIVILSALTATAAMAQPGHLSDAAYLQAARCVGLASSSNLGSNDGAAMSAWLKSQSIGRNEYILEKGDSLQSQAKRQADRADEFSKGKLESELSGMCASLRS